MGGTHALLSASSSHKWLHCTPSARLEETLPDSESDFAKEGSLAHEIAELKVRKAFVEPMGARTYNSKLKKFQNNELYQEEMLRHTDTYLDYISKVMHAFNTAPYIAIEKKIDYSTYAPEGFGTVDCIIICDKTIHIIDFKYGKGVAVSAEENTQMMLYALGAYVEYSFLYQIEQVKMTIVQPRLDCISEYSLPLEQLLSWGETVKELATSAFKGEGDFAPGEHCRFCRANALCKARGEKYLELEEIKMSPALYSVQEIGQILERAQGLAKWAKDLEEYALAEALKGNEVTGWKAVAGRTSRQFTNQDEAFEILKANGIDEAMLYKREPLTLTATEDLLGKAKFKELLENYIIKNQGKPTLAPVSDKREALTRISAAEDFGA